MDRKTDRLSGGEMQRVSIGRAIVRQPRIFLMDEPLSNLDAKLREALRAELKDLKIKLGATFLFVTHDQIEAMSMADRIAVLHAGRIAQVGTPYEMYNEPSDIFVAGFVGTPTMNLLKAEIRDGIALATDGRFEFKLDGVARERFGGANGPLTVGVRAEDIRIGPHEADRGHRAWRREPGRREDSHAADQRLPASSNRSSSLSDCDRGPHPILICQGTVAWI